MSIVPARIDEDGGERTALLGVGYVWRRRGADADPEWGNPPANSQGTCWRISTPVLLFGMALAMTLGDGSPSAVWAAGSCEGTTRGGVSVQGPIMLEPVVPSVQDKNLKEMEKVEPTDPDEPVRVMPDLKEDVEPIVHKAVEPAISDRNLRDAPRVPPVGPDAPVEVRPDLRECDEPDAQGGEAGNAM